MRRGFPCRGILKLIFFGIFYCFIIIPLLADQEIKLLDPYYAWTAVNPQTQLLQTRDSLQISSGGDFAGIVNQRMASALFQDNDCLTFELKAGSSGIGSVFWSNFADQRFVPPRSCSFYLDKPGKWKRYYIYFSSHEKDLNRIDFLLINPFQGSGEAEVRDIKIIKANLFIRLLAGWQEFWGPKGRAVVGYTINTMPSPALFGQPVFVYIYWLIGIVGIALIFFKWKQGFTAIGRDLLLVIFVFWGLLEASCLYSDGKIAKGDFVFLGKTLEQKHAMVNSGDFYSFIQFCQKNLPSSAKYDLMVPPLYNDIKTIYYLLPHKPTSEAKYLVVYDYPIEKGLRYSVLAEFRKGAGIYEKTFGTTK